MEDKDTTSLPEDEDVEAHSPSNLRPGNLGEQPTGLNEQDDEPDFEGHAPSNLRPGNLSPSDL